MNRYEFENLISDYLDGTMPFNKQREFEVYMDQNIEAERLVKNIREEISNMNELKQVKVSASFNDKLLSRVKIEGLTTGPDKNSIFGFSPFYASILSCLCIGLFVIVSQLFNVSGKSDFDNNSNQYKTSLKDDHAINEENNLQENKSLMVDSNIDSVKNNENRKKPRNSNKIKFVNY